MKTSAVITGLAALMLAIGAGTLRAQRDTTRATAFERAALAVEIRNHISALDMAHDSVIKAFEKEDAVASFISNPFALRDPPSYELLRMSRDSLIKLVNLTRDSLSMVQPPSGDPTGGSGGGLLLPSATDLIVGLTDFVVERAKDEVVYSFVLRLKKAVEENQFVQAGMPRSALMMKHIDLQMFQSLMPSLRTAFAQDLNELPRTMGSDNFAKAVNWDSKTQMYAQGVGIVFDRALEIRRGTPPVSALAQLMELPDSALAHRGARTALRLVGQFASEYVVAGGQPLLGQMQDPTGRKYFVALVAHDLRRREKLFDSAAARTFLAQLEKYQLDATQLIQQFNSARLLIDSATAADADALTLKQALAASRSVLRVVSTAWHLVPEAASDPQVGEFLDDAILLNEAVLERNYGAILSWVVQRIESNKEATAGRTTTENTTTRTTTVRDTTVTVTTITVKAIGDTTRSGTINKDSTNSVTLRYLALATSLAAARNSGEVHVALRTAAAPVGSFRAKRSQHPGAFGPFATSITAYPGGSIGLERAEFSSGAPEQSSFVGLSLPIGPELSWGTPWGSLSLFIPILDVGSIASARLKSTDSVKVAPQVGWSQVLAPGAFIVLGITRTSPLSLGVGIQRVSNLRETHGGTNADVLRRSLFVAIDATLFRF